MKFEHAPVAFGVFSADPISLLPVVIVAIVLGLLLFGVRREVATVAILLGVVGALLAA